MSSPYFNAPRSVRGQILIPMGTHHVCPTCRSSHVCDVDGCPRELLTLCPGCGGDPSHAWQDMPGPADDPEPEQGRLF